MTEPGGPARRTTASSDAPVGGQPPERGLGGDADGVGDIESGPAAVGASEVGSAADDDRETAADGPPSTGDRSVDEALGGLSDLLHRPLDAQVEGYATVHARLQDRLADLDE